MQVLVWKPAGAEAVGSRDGIGEGVTVVLIHHFVGVMVGVIDTDVAATSLWFVAASLRRDVPLTSKISKHTNTKMKMDRISIF